MPDNELLVDTLNPKVLDETLQQLGAVLVGGPNDFVQVDGHYVIRALNAVGFVKFACESQGYCTVVDGPGNWTEPVFCQNPECPKVGKCGGECARNF